MATNEEKKKEPQPEPQKFAVKINPDTNLYGHQFTKDFGLTAYQKRLVTQEEYDRYNERHNGLRILIKD